MCSSLFCSTSICANANRAGVSEHHHNHQKAGEGEPMLGGVGLIFACHMSASCDCVLLPCRSAAAIKSTTSSV